MKYRHITTAILITAIVLFAAFFIHGPKRVEAQYSHVTDRTYSAVTETCFALKMTTVLPYDFTGCDIGAVAIGDATTQFDITAPGGDVCTYTYDDTGLDPAITADMPGAAASPPAGSIVEIAAQNFAAGNNGFFLVTASASKVFSVTNAACSAEDDKTIGTGDISYRSWERTFGGPTTQFDISNPTGTTFRYTFDDTGTVPGINSSTFRIGDRVSIAGAAFDYRNNGNFTLTGSGDTYFEVTNASGQAETNVTIGIGSLKNRGQ